MQKLEVSRNRPPFLHSLRSRIHASDADPRDDLERPSQVWDPVDDVQARPLDVSAEKQGGVSKGGEQRRDAAADVVEGDGCGFIEDQAAGAAPQ